jgi:hypothetical protein
MFIKPLNNFILLLILAFLTLLLSEAATFFLDLNRLLYKNLSEQLTLKQIEAYFATQSRWQWLQYVLLPVVLYLKSTVLAWILAIGGFFYGLELSHKNYWKIVLQAEFIFLVSVLVKILWFVIIQPEFSLEEVQQFVPFSLQSILDTTTIPSWALYPLQLLNVFEGLYWVLLVVLLNQASGSKKGALIVVSSYGPALFIWIIFIMFLTLNLN